ncbi:hypothetical protein F5B21DRAFT_228560 [Xylaria acuta]|nr:hypothetical protein F5B21DRAFT_228560 [Xylaria acuta]
MLSMRCTWSLALVSKRCRLGLWIHAWPRPSLSAAVAVNNLCFGPPHLPPVASHQPRPRSPAQVSGLTQVSPPPPLPFVCAQCASNQRPAPTLPQLTTLGPSFFTFSLPRPSPTRNQHPLPLASWSSLGLVGQVALDSLDDGPKRGARWMVRLDDQARPGDTRPHSPPESSCAGSGTLRTNQPSQQAFRLTPQTP